MQNDKKKKEFSKLLLIQESVLVWIVTISFIILAGACIFFGFSSDFPWLTAMAGFPWAAYAVSQACYYNKAKAENVLKISGTLEEELENEERTCGF